MVRSRRVKTVVLVLATLALAGCGRRGRLEPPPDPNAPPQETVSKSGLHKRPRNPPIKAPNDTFILDPLL